MTAGAGWRALGIEADHKADMSSVVNGLSICKLLNPGAKPLASLSGGPLAKRSFVLPWNAARDCSEKLERHFTFNHSTESVKSHEEQIPSLQCVTYRPERGAKTKQFIFPRVHIRQHCLHCGNIFEEEIEYARNFDNSLLIKGVSAK
jgi:hypothetical protein